MLQRVRAKKYFLVAFLVSLAINPIFTFLYRNSKNFVLNCNYFGGLITGNSFLILSLVFLGVVIYFGLISKDSAESIGFGFLVSGGVWNLIHRVAGNCVYDYFKFGPIYTLFLRFNISDVLIWAGLLLVLTTFTQVCIKTLLSKKSIDVKR
ncbi:hypothetical protein A3H26_02220 [candidate division WWE3 bacterium RIFCSPLOWO2_12_FULL_36_10]|uniref:Uncharacterized protein n=1 Tax=candidate division WWE3 bacterium RIFCSPLOWO2_12_FULL_36_10 TaxID=1802630 RepID=A0A1F4VJX3_UNCKA|nr:MAG: hypothetical protein A3H26_02220 [candidate division WWE3 bacterium RIFCSPLOWO2_12_FULL_36_10]